MPSRKRKYNARFPAGRIKKIMQSDEEVGKVAQAVPVIISRTLELFVESLLTKTLKITNSRNAKTLSPSHMKQCIMSESRFDFLRELVKNIPDISIAEETAHESSPGPPMEYSYLKQIYDTSKPSTSCDTNVLLERNGGSSLSNGLQVICTSTTSSTSPSTPTTEYRQGLKRQWESVQSLKKQQADKGSVIQHTSDAAECTVPKLARMDSAPTVCQENNKNSTKRLVHQSKSVPGTSKEANLQQPVVPAPIVNIDICNKPIVKIDYSNLALDDKDSIACGSSSEQNSSLKTCISPVINIDLSKIATQASNELKNISRTTNTLRPSLELDEDYDNI